MDGRMDGWMDGWMDGPTARWRAEWRSGSDISNRNGGEKERRRRTNGRTAIRGSWPRKGEGGVRPFPIYVRSDQLCMMYLHMFVVGVAPTRSTFTGEEKRKRKEEKRKKRKKKLNPTNERSLATKHQTPNTEHRPNERTNERTNEWQATAVMYQAHTYVHVMRVPANRRPRRYGIGRTDKRRKRKKKRKDKKKKQSFRKLGGLGACWRE